MDLIIDLRDLVSEFWKMILISENQRRGGRSTY
jgi:hypothetical protein